MWQYVATTRVGFQTSNLIYETPCTWAGNVDFNAGKTQLVSIDWCNNTGTIDVKMDGYVLEIKYFCNGNWTGKTTDFSVVLQS